jgi:hypothetical protein
VGSKVQSNTKDLECCGNCNCFENDLTCRHEKHNGASVKYWGVCNDWLSDRVENSRRLGVNSGKVKKTKRKSQQKIKRAFILYKKIKNRIEMCAKRRGSKFGIAVDSDPCAKEYQGIYFRLHVLDCILSGRKLNWANAPWLTSEEISNRNGC